MLSLDSAESGILNHVFLKQEHINHTQKQIWKLTLKSQITKKLGLVHLWGQGKKN